MLRFVVSWVVLWLCLRKSSGECDHVRFASSYWVSSKALGDHWGEVVGSLSYAHVALDSLEALDGSDDVKGIVDVYWVVFNFTDNTVRSDIDVQLELLQKSLLGYVDRGKVGAFYMLDEPTLNNFTTEVLETGIAHVKGVFPGIPTYIVYARHCFDPQSFCYSTLPAPSRAVPSNLDWVGFDWYMTSTPFGSQFEDNIRQGVALLTQLTKASIVLIPDALSQFLPEAALLQIQHAYFAEAYSNPRIIGLDFFLWADNGHTFQGLASMTSVRYLTKAFSREIRYRCGESPTIVPAFLYANGVDFYYSGWSWLQFNASGYISQGIAFGMAPDDQGGAEVFYQCAIMQKQYENHWLTFSPECDGLPLAPGSTPVKLGYAWTEQVNPSLLPLHRFDAVQVPWPHYYSTDPTTPPGFIYEGITAYVISLSAL